MQLQGFKYRIYPTEQQRILLAQMFGSSRYVYNWGLDRCIKAREAGEKKPSYFDLTKELTQLKKQPETIWLAQTPSMVLYFALKNLDAAYQKFFKEKKGFPKFKSKHDNNKSIGSAEGTKVFFDKNLVQFSFLGKIKATLHRSFEGVCKTSVISQTPTGKYYISITVENKNYCTVPKKEVTPDTSVGIDTGIKTYAVLSDSTEYENPKHLRTALRRLKRLQRAVSRKKKGSENRKKAVTKLAFAHEKVAFRRKDFASNLSRKIVNNFDTVIVEDLNIAGMVKNRRLAFSITDLGLGMFYNMLKYKIEDKGGTFIKIGRFEPSSKTCSNCGYVYSELKLVQRHWTCNGCGVTHDRDLNAAINIKKIGLDAKRTENRHG